jgi:predicted ABC-type ATPase
VSVADAWSYGVTDAAAPGVVVLGGPNGAGKTTAAPRLLRGSLKVDEFVNADTLAQGLSAFRPADVAVEAGRLTLARLDALQAQGKSFAFEATLAGRGLIGRLRRLRASGYTIHVVYLWLPTVDLALARVSERVLVGGHDVPADAVRRRYARGREHFFRQYRAIADTWYLYDASPIEGPLLIAIGGRDGSTTVRDQLRWRLAAAGYLDE